MPDSQRGLRLIGCLAVCLCLSLCYALGFGTYQLVERDQRAQQQQQARTFWEAWNHVEESFYGEVPSAKERTYGAIHESLKLLDDPYTIFVEPQPRELERDRMKGVFGGIGVDLWRDAEGRMLLSPYPDSPAEEAGIQEGDILLALDGEEVTAETTSDDVRAYLHGEVGTSVTLTLTRLDPEKDTPTPPFDLVVVREEIQVPSVTWRVLDRAPEIGYVRIEYFSSRTDEEIVPALEELQRAEVTGLILDLRNNYGGMVDSAVGTASQFLEDGVVLYEQRRSSEEKTYPVRDGGVAPDIPLVVLVNGGTSSAAEIVAGALQDHGRAVLIGEGTYGKGAVQLIYELSDGSSLHITAAIWLTPDRHRIEGQGLAPDVPIPQGEGPQDEQLDRAVEHLRSR